MSPRQRIEPVPEPGMGLEIMATAKLIGQFVFRALDVNMSILGNNLKDRFRNY